MEQRKEKGETFCEQDAERQGEDDQTWEVAAKPRRKTSGVSSEETKVEGKEGREEWTEEVGNEEGYVLRGTQTECMHTPISDLTSDGDIEEEAESEEKSEDSFIKNLLAHVNMDS